LYHKTFEALQLKSSIRSMSNVFNAPFEAPLLFDIALKDLPLNVKDAETLRYKGNPLYDFFFGLYYLSDNWDYLGLMSMGTDFEGWIFGDDDTFSFTHVIEGYRCNSDSMGHPNKGLIGLRLDGVSNITVTNVKVSNLLEDSNLGSDLCGEYETIFQTQRVPYQIGYSGNIVQGISIDYSTTHLQDVTVENIESSTGLTVGISFWYGSSVKLAGDITIRNIQSGAKVEPGILTYESSPNRSPESCAMRMPAVEYPSYQREQNIRLDKNINLVIQCVSGHIGCNGETDNTNVGEYSGCATILDETFSLKTTSKASSQFSTASVISTITVILILSIITYKKYWYNTSSYSLLK